MGERSGAPNLSLPEKTGPEGLSRSAIFQGAKAPCSLRFFEQADFSGRKIFEQADFRSFRCFEQEDFSGKQIFDQRLLNP
jgi:hypothetical protein